MLEPYFESNRSAAGSIHFPYESMIHSSKKARCIVGPHWHLYIEMLYLLSGKAKVYLGAECHTLGKGDLILIHSHETHSIYSVDDEVSYIVVKFDPEILYSTSRTFLESKYILPFTLADSRGQRVFTEPEIQDTPIPSLIREIYDEFSSKGFGFELAVRTLICRVFLWFLRKTHHQQWGWEVSHSLNDSDYQMLQKVFEYIDYNYMNDINAQTAARLCNMSYSYFSRRFKSIMGKTFTNYLSYIRITEAEKLLLTTDMSMTQIALEVGFSSSSYFIQQFRQYKNISPHQFRKKGKA
ncbi:helix-turn-helix domain-containing protein [Paenibacillus sp. HJL G12]|uniref:Helix-turn-helix domain-containing protein n=1 Tax=Paenibacillus dendrobii TaxID=2691084 RepID=A0A7X3II80_9BACL|nr:AraC family transcriptional regulator [Paenibacillus dendrobii]MWV43005.1 helix-turn-helix domain-containing protein [Paenibacillus dendrobii]